MLVGQTPRSYWEINSPFLLSSKARQTYSKLEAPVTDKSGGNNFSKKTRTCCIVWSIAHNRYYNHKVLTYKDIPFSFGRNGVVGTYVCVCVHLEEDGNHKHIGDTPHHTQLDWCSTALFDRGISTIVAFCWGVAVANTQPELNSIRPRLWLWQLPTKVIVTHPVWGLNPRPHD